MESVAVARDMTPEGEPVAKRPRLQDGPSVDSAKVIIDSHGITEEVSMDLVAPAHSTATHSRAQTKGKSKDRDGTKKNGQGRGGWRTRNEEGSPQPDRLDEHGQPIPKAPRYPKRQCALLIGFCGSGYSGMQVQPDHTRTIEGVLFQALVKVGAVSQDNADNPTKVGLARAARTDAGVHAAGNVVSLKMIVTIPGVSNLVNAINQELPPEIRLWGFGRTQNSFNARLICESRKYTYFFPTYLLIPPKPGSGLQRALEEYSEQENSQPSTLKSDEFWHNQTEGTKEDDLLRKRAFRVRPEQMAKLRELARRYEGTHNFHNFTVDRDYTDRSNNRYMKKIEIADPVVYGETEWVSILFHGQSFMLHQIRKMMSILVLSCRLQTPPSVINELYGPQTIFVPKMPSLGLLLEEPLFESYNQRMSVINEKLSPSDAEYRPLIDFDIHRDKMNAFKEEFIYKNMRTVEDRDGIFDAWVRTVDLYAGRDLLYLNPTGRIPPESVVKKGVRRDNPFREKRFFDSTSFPANAGARSLLEEDVEGEEDEMLLDKRKLEEMEG